MQAIPVSIFSAFCIVTLPSAVVKELSKNIFKGQTHLSSRAEAIKSGESYQQEPEAAGHGEPRARMPRGAAPHSSAPFRAVCDPQPAEQSLAPTSAILV